LRLRNRLRKLKLKKRKMNESSAEERRKLQEQIAMMEILAKKYMSGEAITRYGNIKVAHPEMAVKLVALIVQAVQAGQISGKISDAQLKVLLVQMQPQKREFRFVRK